MSLQGMELKLLFNDNGCTANSVLNIIVGGKGHEETHFFFGNNYGGT